MTTALYASTANVRTALGKLGNRLPPEIDVDSFLSMAHAELVDALGALYPNAIPAFAGNGLEAVKWAEAKLAAAEIADVLAEALRDNGATATGLRKGVAATLEGGIVGYPLGSDTVDSSTPAIAGPRVSSYTPVSAFPDPYCDARRPNAIPAFGTVDDGI